MRYVALGALAAALLLGTIGAPGAGAAMGEGAWHRVQLARTITGADRAALDAAGVRAPLYVPRDAYVAWLDPATVAAARGLATVTSVRQLGRGDKIAADLAGTAEGGLVRASALVYGDRLTQARTALAALGDVAAAAPAPGAPLAEVLLTVGAGDLAAVADVPEVLYVGPARSGPFPEDEASAQIVAGNLDAAGTRPVPGYESWLRALGLDGAGVKIAVVDTGVDEKHPDLAGRVEKRVDYATVPEPEDSFGHGTHVGGIVAGNAAALREAGGVKDLNGFYYGLGVAPAARLLDQNAIATSVLDWPPPYGFARLTSDALAAGASTWNASWHTGEGTGAGYIATARTMDTLVRDGDPATAAAEPFTMVFSAGNAGPNPRTMTSPKEAKNIITVGSTVSHRGGSIDAVSSFSSRGPARDGRIAPTVAAPGGTIVSTRSLPASAVCNQPPTDGNSFGLYGVCSGTSMAAPHVAGAVALVTQWWRNRTGGASPSPALTKALLVNTATDIGAPDIPNGNEGWGRVNLGQLFDPGAKRTYVDQRWVFTDPGERRVFSVKPADPAKPLKVTLVWTDAPGTPQADPTAPALVNDLDLVVEGQRTMYRGNVFERGVSVGGGAADRLNNVESVYVRAPGDKTHRVVVEAANLPGDGAPGAGDTTDQDFALVISNAVPAELAPTPVLGTPYVSYTFDAGAEGWSVSGIPTTWSRSAPGTKTGADDPLTSSYAIEGRTQYLDNMNASLVSPWIATEPGWAVVAAWLKLGSEAGFDFLRVEWTADGTNWRGIDQFSGRNADYPRWTPFRLGFYSPGGDIRVRFRFTSDAIISGLTDASLTGVRVDEVVVGKQAG